MSRIGFIEIHKLLGFGTGIKPTADEPALINVTAIASISKAGSNTWIKLADRNSAGFAVAESYEQVLALLGNAGGKVNRAPEEISEADFTAKFLAVHPKFADTEHNARLLVLARQGKKSTLEDLHVAYLEVEKSGLMEVAANAR